MAQWRNTDASMWPQTCQLTALSLLTLLWRFYLQVTFQCLPRAHVKYGSPPVWQWGINLISSVSFHFGHERRCTFIRAAWDHCQEFSSHWPKASGFTIIGGSNLGSEGLIKWNYDAHKFEGLDLHVCVNQCPFPVSCWGLEPFGGKFT